MPETSASANPATARPKRENLLLNIGLNVLLPSLILSKGAQWFGLSPTPVLVIALLFPLGHGIHDFASRRKANLFSIIGFLSTLVTGGVGVLALDKDLIAWKEGLIPFLFGLLTLVSLRTRFPLVRSMLYNPDIFDVAKIDAGLTARDTHPQFERLMARCTCILAASFFMSAALNFALARWIVVSETQTEAFNQEIARMNLLSWPVIVLPSMIVSGIAIMQLVKGIRSLAGLSMEEALHAR